MGIVKAAPKPASLFYTRPRKHDHTQFKWEAAITKVHVAETVTIALPAGTLTINVEDASKGDVISGKVLTVSRDFDDYKVGNVYEFPRDQIKA